MAGTAAPLSTSLDFVRDELRANGPTCPPADRVQAVMRVGREAAARSGLTVAYAFDVTDGVEAGIRALLEEAEALGRPVERG